MTHAVPRHQHAAALFEVKTNEELHALLNEWAELIPAHFDTYPLIDPKAAQAYLSGRRGR